MTDTIYFNDAIPKNEDFLAEAVNRCLDSMYRLSQPSITLEELKEIGKNTTKEEHAQNPLYQRYYLPQDLYTEIIYQYLDVYGLKSDWHDYVNVIREYLVKGGNTDTYKPNKDGEMVRTYEKTPTLESLIGKEHTDEVLKLIQLCDDFYTFNRNECAFRMNVMNYSPCSNPDTVEQYWHEHGAPEFKINHDFYTQEIEDED